MSSRVWSSLPLSTFHELQGLVVVAAEHAEAFRTAAEDGLNLADVAGSLLDAHNVGNVPRQSQGGFCFYIAARTAGHIVQDDGLVRALCEGFEVCVEAPLRRFVVEGCHNQIGVSILQEAHIGQGAAYAVGAHAGHHRFPGGVLQGNLQHLEFFRFCKRGCFPGGAQRNQEVHAGSHLPVHRGGKCLIIHFFPFERGQKCRS